MVNILLFMAFILLALGIGTVLTMGIFPNEFRKHYLRGKIKNER